MSSAPPPTPASQGSPASDLHVAPPTIHSSPIPPAMPHDIPMIPANHVSQGAIQDSDITKLPVESASTAPIATHAPLCHVIAPADARPSIPATIAPAEPHVSVLSNAAPALPRPAVAEVPILDILNTQAPARSRSESSITVHRYPERVDTRLDLPAHSSSHKGLEEHDAPPRVETPCGLVPPTRPGYLRASASEDDLHPGRASPNIPPHYLA